MKRIILFFALFAASASISAQETRYYNAAELNVIGKAIPTSKDFTRIDTSAYKFNDKVIDEYACHSTGLAVLFATDSPFIKAKWVTSSKNASENMTAIAQKGLDLYIRKDGEWVFAYGETDGYEFTAEEEGIESGISINISDSTAKYYSKTEFTDEKFDAELEIIEEPVYVGCGNDAWKVKFNTYNSTFGEDEEFYATLIDENTLLLRHLFPFDGTQGVSHQTYTRR